MTAGQLVAIILFIIGGVLQLLVVVYPGADARLGWVGGALVALGGVFLTLDVSGSLK